MAEPIDISIQALYDYKKDIRFFTQYPDNISIQALYDYKDGWPTIRSPTSGISIQALYDYKVVRVNIVDRTLIFQFKHCTIISKQAIALHKSPVISIQALYDYKVSTI